MRKVLLVFLILLAGGVVVADRVGVKIAEDQIGQRVAAQYNLQQQPKVVIHGFPFLTQAVAGEYDQIDVSLGDWREQGVTVKNVNVEMRGVRAPLNEVINGNKPHVTARTATASAVVPYQVLQERAPQGVQHIGPNGSDLQLSGKYAFLGVSTDIDVVVSVKATGRGIAITPQSVGSAGIQVPVSLLQQRLTYYVPVRNLPIGSRITDITVTPDGLRVAATAQNVDFNNLPAA